MLAKHTVDGIAMNTWITARAASGKKGRSMNRPRPFPSPIAESRLNAAKKPRMTLAEFARRIPAPPMS